MSVHRPHRHHKRSSSSSSSSSLNNKYTQRHIYKDTNTCPVPGLSSVRALLSTRPHDVRRIYFAPERKELLIETGVLKWAADNRKAYTEVKNNSELERISGTNHHEGLCVVADVKPALSMEQWISAAASASTSSISTTTTTTTTPSSSSSSMVITGIANPFTLGALIRTAVFFGTRHVLHVRSRDMPAITAPAVYRASGGCSEYVQHAEIGSAGEAVAALRRLRVHHDVGRIIGLSEIEGDDFNTLNILDYNDNNSDNDKNRNNAHGKEKSCVVVEGEASKNAKDLKRQCKIWMCTQNKEGYSLGIAPALAAVLQYKSLKEI